MATIAHLTDLLRHNAWANRAVLDTFREAEHVLDAPDRDGDPLRERAGHLARTERGFLMVIRGDTEPRHAPPDTLAGLIAYCDEAGAGLVEVVSGLTADDLVTMRYVPWWEREFPVLTLVAQVLAHSTQHRAELAWELARAGISTGEIDFIVWKLGGEPAPGEKPDLPDDDDEDLGLER